jgi:hypothetical protein
MNSTAKDNAMKLLLDNISEKQTRFESETKYIKYLSVNDRTQERWTSDDMALYRTISDDIESADQESIEYELVPAIDHAETELILGRRNESLKIIHGIEKYLSHHRTVYDRDIMFAYRELMILEGIAGIELKGFDMGFNFLREMSQSQLQTKNGYSELAVSSADVFHFTNDIRERTDKIKLCIRKSGGTDEQIGVAGIVFRKLCMRSEQSSAKTPEFVSFAEENFLPLQRSDILERTFSYSQAALSLALLSAKLPENSEPLKKRSEEYITMMDKSVGPRSKELVRIMKDVHKLRVFSQIGDIERCMTLGKRLFEDFIKSSNDFLEMHDMIYNPETLVGGKITHEIREMRFEVDNMYESYSLAYIMGFMLAGRFAASKKLQADLLGKTEKLLQLDMPPFFRTERLLDLSSAFADTGNDDKAFDYLKKAYSLVLTFGSSERKELIVDKFTRTISENYVLSGNSKFIQKYSDMLRENSISGSRLEEASRFFIDNASFYAASKFWDTSFN